MCSKLTYQEINKDNTMQFNKSLLTPSLIAKDMHKSIAELDDFAGWQDYFEGGAGQTIVELVAGSQAIKNHYNMMRVRESSLIHAKMDSSITQLAIDKGVYRPTAKAFIVRLKFKSLLSGEIGIGELIGSYKDYNAYSLEHKSIVVGDNELDITFGHIVEHTTEIVTDETFHFIPYSYDNLFVADHFQLLTHNGQQVILSSIQLNLYNNDLANSALTLVSSFENKIVFGDGVIGKKTNIGDVIKLRDLTYGKDMIKKYDHSKLNMNDADMFHIDSFEVIRRATGYLDKEILRRVAIRSTVDGRWVQTIDFENGLMREFGEFLSDVIVEDSYPIEFITFLPKSGFLTPGLLEEINTMIEDKRGNAVQVKQTVIDPDSPENYIDLTFNMTYFGIDSEEVIRQIIEDYTTKNERRLANGDIFVVGADIAVELTRELPQGKFYCDLDQKFVLPNLKFIRELKINFVRE